MAADHRRELLRTQAMTALLTTLGGNEVHIYGDKPYQYKGTYLVDQDNICMVTHWADENGAMWEYKVHVGVIVERRELKNA